MRVTDLGEYGYVRVAYPEPLRKLVERSMRGWRSYCALAPDEKRCCSKEGDRHTDFGYMLRTDPDSKEQFHVALKDIPELKRRCCRIHDPHAIEFVLATDILMRTIQPLIAAFVESVESVYGVRGFHQEVMSAIDCWTLRYVHYYGGVPILATEHVDRGGFTLHLYESDVGGEYFGFDYVWHPFPIDEKHTIIFPSLGLQRRSKSLLKALWHRVLAVPATHDSGRYALVAFIDFPGFECTNVKEKFGVQPVGFNYAMRPEEFEMLCVG